MVNVIGKKLIDFTDKDGKQIKGLRLYYTAPDDGVEGLASAYLFVGSDKNFYEKVRTLKVPFNAELIYSVSLSSGKPFLSDVKLV